MLLFDLYCVHRITTARKLCLQLLSHFLHSGLYFFRPQSPRKNAHSLLRYFGIRGICITSLPVPVFVGLLLKIEKRPTSPETVRFRGDFGRFCLIWGGFTMVGKARYLLPCGNRKAPHRCGAFALSRRWNGGDGREYNLSLMVGKPTTTLLKWKFVKISIKFKDFFLFR